MYKSLFGRARQRVKLSEFKLFNFAYFPVRILNILVFWDVYKWSFWLIFIYFVKVFEIPKNLAFDTFKVAIAETQKLSRRTGYSAKTGLAAWYFDPRWAFKAKVGSEDETARGVEIKQQEAVRQSTENIARIAPTGSFEVVEKDWILIIAGLLKQKLKGRTRRHEDAKSSSKRPCAKAWKT